MNTEIPIAAFEPAERLIDRFVPARLFVLAPVGLFSLVSFVVASLGVYSVAAESASRRTREVGIRFALVAPVQGVWRDLVIAGMHPVAFGLAIGMASSHGLARILQGTFFGVGAIVPSSSLAPAADTVLSALVACYAPFWRASRVEPSAELPEA